MVRWLAAVYTLIISVIIAFVLLTITGLIQPQDKLIEYAQSIQAFAPYVETYYVGAQWQDWHAEKQAEFDAIHQEIEAQHQSLNAKEQQLHVLSQSLARQEQTLNEQRAKSQSAANLARLYSQMRPEEAVEILQLMDQELILEVLLAMDEETAALVLAALPRSLAAELSTRSQEGR